MMQYTRAAKRNLREGIKKMEQRMSTAAQVRRAFQLGRPPRPLADGEVPERLHPVAVWNRANEALSDLRTRMTTAKLNPRHVAAAIVFVERVSPEQPCFLFLEERGKTPEEVQNVAFGTLNSTDVIELGMIFVQLDEQTQHKAIFPYLFFGLNQRGMAVLRRAAAEEFTAGELLKNVN